MDRSKSGSPDFGRKAKSSVSSDPNGACTDSVQGRLCESSVVSDAGLPPKVGVRAGDPTSSHELSDSAVVYDDPTGWPNQAKS